jgi:hypothetical protein
MTTGRPEGGRRDARQAIFEAIDAHDDADDPARISAVVEDAVVADVAGPSAVFDAFATLFRHGDVYEPRPGHVRRTTPLDDGDG